MPGKPLGALLLLRPLPLPWKWLPSLALQLLRVLDGQTQPDGRLLRLLQLRLLGRPHHRRRRPKMEAAVSALLLPLHLTPCS